MTRREWLQKTGSAAGVWWMTGNRASHARPGDGHKTGSARKTARTDKRTARDAVDHLLLSAADLDHAIAWFATRAGVKAVFGGNHPGMGTRNALISLGRRQYLEIIAPDPAQKAFKFQIDLRRMAAPRLVNWAVASNEVEAAAAVAIRAKYPVFGPQEGARTRPDGSTLMWRTVGVLAPFRDPEVDPMPFFIQWGEGVKHPSEDAPGGCRLIAFDLRHPDPAGLQSTLDLFGIRAVVTKAERPGLTATLDTPRGQVVL